MTRTPAISWIFSSIEERVSGISFLRIFLIRLSMDLTRDLISSIGLRSYSREYCSFNTLNFVSTSMMAH